MKASITYQDQTYLIDLSKPIDISIPVTNKEDQVNAWYIDAPEIKPVVLGDWIGSVKKGASTNFNNIYFNPHSHGTHTECVGHITSDFHSVHHTVKKSFFITEVISIQPERKEGDFVISRTVLEELICSKPEALVIRTLPNTENKRSKQYSHTNWPYLTKEAAAYLCDLGILHLLIDLPSVDKEKDDGKLEAHKAFWDLTGKTRFEATITEFIYVDNKIKDGIYFLDLQVAPIVNDASPSKPLLYAIKSINSKS